MSVGQRANNSLVMSYLMLRKSIGVLGVCLPFVLWMGGRILFDETIQSSLSAYYYTGMRNVFVGVLCAIGFFLFAYNGYDQRDNRAGNLACIFAIGTAWFPTAPAGVTAGLPVTIGRVHLTFAALFFLTLVYFSLFLFTETAGSKEERTHKKCQRDVIYRICGYTILGCMILVALLFLLPDDVEAGLQRFNVVFWLEAIAIVAFGFSWLTKGEAIRMLNDPI